MNYEDGKYERIHSGASLFHQNFTEEYPVFKDDPYRVNAGRLPRKVRQVFLSVHCCQIIEKNYPPFQIRYFNPEGFCRNGYGKFILPGIGDDHQQTAAGKGGRNPCTGINADQFMV